MKKWTKEELEAEGYIIENARIIYANISMEEHDITCLSMPLEGVNCIYNGGIVLGNGHVEAKDEYCSALGAGIECIMRIMDVVGASRFSDLKGSYIRAAHKGWGSSVKIIGNIITDKWFDPEFFSRIMSKRRRAHEHRKSPDQSEIKPHNRRSIRIHEYRNM